MTNVMTTSRPQRCRVRNGSFRATRLDSCPLASATKRPGLGRKRSLDYTHAPWHRDDAFGVAVADGE